MNPLTDMELAYQKFLAKHNLMPDLNVKVAFLAGYAAGHECAHQYWSEQVDKMVQGICIA
jgi:hypothetical protein